MPLNEIEKASIYFRDNVNVVSFLGLCLLFLAKVRLLCHILRKRSCAGISGNTQILYMLVFISRCLDLVTIGRFTEHVPILICIFKSLWVPVMYVILLLIYSVYKSTHENDFDDSKLMILLIAPCAILAVHETYWPVNRAFWSFSFYLEAVACFPQYRYNFTMDGQTSNFVSCYLSMIAFAKLIVVGAESYNYFYAAWIFDSKILACSLIQLLFFYGFVEYSGVDEEKTRKRGRDEESLSRHETTVNLPYSTTPVVATVDGLHSQNRGANRPLIPAVVPNDYV